MRFILGDFNGRVVNQPGLIQIPERTNGILVTNISPVGGPVITVNGYPLNPRPVAGANGESWSVGFHQFEIIQRDTLDIRFAAGGIAFVQFKWYVGDNC